MAAGVSIGSTPAKVIQTAVNTAKDSNKPLSGSPASMIQQQYNKHPVEPKSY